MIKPRASRMAKFQKSEGNVHSESQEIQERWMFMLIASLLEQDKEPKLLVRLYLQLYQQNRNEKKPIIAGEF